MLVSSPLNGEVVPPPRTTLQWKDAFHARQRIAGVLLANAKARHVAAPRTVLPVNPHWQFLFRYV